MFRRNKTTQKPESPVVYPSGVFVHTEKGYFYIVAPGKRYRLLTKRLLDSWNPQRVIETSEAAVSKYRIAAKMKFRNGSLLYDYADGRLYLISEGLRRHIQNPDWLTTLAIKNTDDAVRVSREEINLHEEGEPLS